jgi:predicted PurR-regulated permease PerM
MFKNFKKNEKYLTIALYAFVVMALLIALIFAFINLDKINTAISGFFKAISAFIYGFVIAYICNPIYKVISKYVFRFVDKNKPRPKLKKALSLLLTYIILFAIITVLIFAIVPAIVDNLYNLYTKLSEASISEWFNNIIDSINAKFPDLNISIDVDVVSAKIFAAIQNIFINEEGDLRVENIGNWASAVVGFIISSIDVIFSIIVGIILSVYFLIHGKRIGAKLRKMLAATFKKENYDKIIDFARYSDKTFGRYLIGTLSDSAIVGIVVGVLTAILGMPYAPLIGVIVGVTNIIPFFGPFIGAIPSALIILIASGEIWRVIVFVILIVVVQQLDGNILAPHIIGGSVGLTPIGVIAAVTICSHFLGVLGMVIGVPLSAVLAYILNKIIDKKLKKKNLPSDTTLYENADFFQSEEFIKASFDVEAQSRLEMKEAVEKAKENLELHQIGIHEAEERITNEKGQVAMEAHTSPDEAYVNTAEIDVNTSSSDNK